ncbi:MAG: SigB/SigF/SigG family RNA polymerase sigma factor [Clostridia bacterium]|nr:SigB/SigF/SigG family RNA polymerase sigma factor [Clostridia bacterium]
MDLLDHEETQRLIILAQKGDDNAKTLLLENNSPLIKSILRRYRNKGVEYDDLYQLGCIGLLKAIYNFNSEFCVRFSTYAVPMIAGEIKRYLRDDGYVKVSRSTKTLACKIMRYCEGIKNSEGRSPTVEEIAKEFEIDAQEVVFALDSTKIPLSLYDKCEDDSGQALFEKISDGDTTDERIDRMIIRDGIAKLNERERKIILLRYFKDKTQSEVAKEMCVSQVQISRLESKIIKKLKEGFE